VSLPVEVDGADQYAALFACTALMASYFELLSTCARFLEDRGVATNTAREYVAGLFHALGCVARHDRGKPFADLAREHMTRGGLNEQVLSELTTSGVYASCRSALERVLHRIEGSAAR
jgi:pyrroline-5-carboxylate reductase